VVDTSYLLELYRVPGCFDEAKATAIRQRWGDALRRRDRLYVPLGCIFETGNHVADLKVPEQRKRWAAILRRDVESAIKLARPFVVIDAPPRDELPPLIIEWEKHHVAHGRPRGLVDVATIVAAKRIKAERGFALMGVHIWTRDRALKGAEPDPEQDPVL